MGKTGEVNSTKLVSQVMRLPVEFSVDVTLVSI
jgi:virulence-associated protein VagC